MSKSCQIQELFAIAWIRVNRSVCFYTVLPLINYEGQTVEFFFKSTESLNV